MMRKLLVLLIVLAMASVAQASVIDLVISSLNDNPISPVSEITIGISDTINFDIVYTQAGDLALLSLDTQITASGPGTLDMSSPTWHAASSPEFNRILEHTAGKDYTVASGSFSGFGDGWLVDHLLLHCEDLGDVIISLAPDTRGGGGTLYVNATPYTGGWGPGVTVHQIPEPMTVALLGLGGLALLRRRK